jgi:putative spermidine/putrescine transport system permease protein
VTPFGRIDLPFALTGPIGVCSSGARLGIPFVIITVTATLVGFDPIPASTGHDMGANPVTRSSELQMPLILPGVCQVVYSPSSHRLVMKSWSSSVGSAGKETLPWQMFTGLREPSAGLFWQFAWRAPCLLPDRGAMRVNRLRGLSPAWVWFHLNDQDGAGVYPALSLLGRSEAWTWGQ